MVDGQTKHAKPVKHEGPDSVIVGVKKRAVVYLPTGDSHANLLAVGTSGDSVFNDPNKRFARAYNNSDKWLEGKIDSAGNIDYSIHTREKFPKKNVTVEPISIADTARKPEYTARATGPTLKDLQATQQKKTAVLHPSVQGSKDSVMDNHKQYGVAHIVGKNEGLITTGIDSQGNPIVEFNDPASKYKRFYNTGKQVKLPTNPTHQATPSVTQYQLDPSKRKTLEAIAANLPDAVRSWDRLNIVDYDKINNVNYAVFLQNSGDVTSYLSTRWNQIFNFLKFDPDSVKDLSKMVDIVTFNAKQQYGVSLNPNDISFKTHYDENAKHRVIDDVLYMGKRTPEIARQHVVSTDKRSDYQTNKGHITIHKDTKIWMPFDVLIAYHRANHDENKANALDELVNGRHPIAQDNSTARTQPPAETKPEPAMPKYVSPAPAPISVPEYPSPYVGIVTEFGGRVPPRAFGLQGGYTNFDFLGTKASAGINVTYMGGSDNYPTKEYPGPVGNTTIHSNDEVGIGFNFLLRPWNGTDLKFGPGFKSYLTSRTSNEFIFDENGNVLKSNTGKSQKSDWKTFGTLNTEYKWADQWQTNAYAGFSKGNAPRFGVGLGYRFSK
jgi:hypothetical protein